MVPQTCRRSVILALVLALFAAAAPLARAAAPGSDGRALIQSMSDTIIATLRAGADKAEREARVREMYQRFFDGDGIAATVIGRPLRQATPPQAQRLRGAFDDYVVALCGAKLAAYSGERLVVLGSEEPEGNGLVVITQIVDPASDSARSVELKWRLVLVGGRLKVHDVLIQNISMVQTLRHELAALGQQRGDNVDGFIAALRAEAAELEQRSPR